MFHVLYFSLNKYFNLSLSRCINPSNNCFFYTRHIKIVNHFYHENTLSLITKLKYFVVKINSVATSNVEVCLETLSKIIMIWMVIVSYHIWVFIESIFKLRYLNQLCMQLDFLHSCVCFVSCWAPCWWPFVLGCVWDELIGCLPSFLVFVCIFCFPYILDKNNINKIHKIVIKKVVVSENYKRYNYFLPEISSFHKFLKFMSTRSLVCPRRLLLLF
jgi:hypothetical protein